jgi:hypothetical protein
MISRLLLLAVFLLAGPLGAQSLFPVHLGTLTCEPLPNPVGLAAGTYHFSFSRQLIK